MSVRAFLDKVDVGPSPAECWEWTGALGSDGYGRLKRSGKTWQAHRYAYEVLKGPIPEDLCVLHQCDNVRCVNPTHLFLGTKRDNVGDMFQKGRQGFSARKLDASQVQEIRDRLARGETKQALAEAFGVCRSTIQDIDNGTYWKKSVAGSQQLMLMFGHEASSTE